MKSTNTKDAAESYGDKVRKQYDTQNVRAIMGRFFSAVSWRND
jgi:hypothetical protein